MRLERWAVYVQDVVNLLPRWFFALLAAMGCVVMGFSWAASLSRRVSALLAWARVLLKLEAGLAYRVHTLEQMIQRAGEEEAYLPVKAALLAASSRMQNNPLETLQHAMAGQSLVDLTKADQMVLLPLFQGLGVLEETAQRGLIQAVRASLDLQIAEARDAEQRNRRLAFSLGMIGGLTVFLFLL